VSEVIEDGVYDFVVEDFFANDFNFEIKNFISRNKNYKMEKRNRSSNEAK